MISGEQLKDKHSETSEELRRQLKEKEALLKQYRSSHGKLELFFDDVKQAITPISSIEPYVCDDLISGSRTDMCVHITDGHLGARQEPDEIENFNAYNIDICQRRQIGFIERVINYTYRMRKSFNIKHCSVLVTGDMISGDIHDELKITNEVPSPVQCVMAGDLLGTQIMMLAGHFDTVTVEFIVADNHSRLTKKPQSKEEGKNSFNYVVGYVAKIRTEVQENVKFNLHPQYEKVVDVNSRRYLILHGHNIRGWMGIPFYGIERKIAKESTARMQLMMDEFFIKKNEIGFHKLIMGHYHTPMVAPLYSIGPSVQGTDAYDHKDGRHADPAQSCWLVNKHGELGRVDFNLKSIL